MTTWTRHQSRRPGVQLRLWAQEQSGRESFVSSESRSRDTIHSSTEAHVLLADPGCVMRTT